MKFSITKKLAINLLILLVALGLAAAVILSSLHFTDVRVKRVQELNRTAELTTELQVLVGALIMPANDYLITGDTAERRGFQRLSSQMEGLLNRLGGRDLGGRAALLEKVNRSYDSVKTLSEQILEIPNPKGDAAAAETMETMDREADGLIAGAREMREEFAREVRIALADAERRTAFVQMVLLISGALLAGMIVLVFLTVNRDMVAPMRLLIQSARQAATGDLTRLIDVGSGNGFDELAAAFNTMITNLRNLVGGMTELAAEVTASSGSLAANAAKMTEQSAQVARTIEELAAGADEQARQAASTGERVSNMHSEVDSVSSLISTISDEAGLMKLTADEGGRSAERAVREITGVRQGMDGIVTSVENLGSRSSQVGRIVEAISAIAEQTNLLALNAAIEAARAGEQGRGFAVVAEEVRQLAEESKSSAARIAQLIGEIQADIAFAVEASRGGGKRVDEGAAAVADMGEVLKRLVSAVQTVSSAVDDSVVRATSLKKDAADTAGLVGTIASITEESAAGAAEVAASIDAQSAAIRQIAISADALARLAGDLNQAVSSFRV